MKVLVACEFSGVVRRAFQALGHETWSCDLEPAEDGSLWHAQGDVRRLLALGWDLMIAHPPCTYLCSSGARWWKGREQEQKRAIEFFLELARAPIERIALENPIGRLSTAICLPHQIIQPWQFGHPETKATCLWLKNLPKLNYTLIVEPDYIRKSDGSLRLDKKGKRCSRIHWLSGRNPDRSKIRSRTYPGIAKAMAEQWTIATN